MLFSAWCAWWAACSGIELLASMALVRESSTRFFFCSFKKAEMRLHFTTANFAKNCTTILPHYLKY
jgi:hypothetical protein